MTVETVPLPCPHCGRATHRAVAWIQQNARAVCSYCATGFLIDKDKIALWVAEQERQERQSGFADPPGRIG